MARQREAVRVRQDRPFKGRQFNAEVILWAVRWYLMFPISYRDQSADMTSDPGRSRRLFRSKCSRNSGVVTHKVGVPVDLR
jgi:hypothetical protein